MFNNVFCVEEEEGRSTVGGIMTLGGSVLFLYGCFGCVLMCVKSYVETPAAYWDRHSTFSCNREYGSINDCQLICINERG